MSFANPIDLSDADFERLRELRAGFLDAGSRAPGSQLPDYWRARRDLEIYDATFGARIGWKWNAVLDDIERRALQPPAGTLVDWGAGTGVAARAFLARFGIRASWRVHMVERSAPARAFARERLAAEHPALVIDDAPCARPDVLLISHVLDELDEIARAELAMLARASRFVVWVESASKATARSLSTLRAELLDELVPLLPCPHASACGVLAPGHENDWCHHFARPAPEAFTTRHWALFSRELGIDLRALPYSYLVLARRGEASERSPGSARILGRPEVSRGRVRLQACTESGLDTLTLLERTDKRRARELADAAGSDLLLRLSVEGERITGISSSER